ncbi:ankyrin repeat protein [Thraustotheca clavata]|uniref:Ankyrin repeat protein n=1 Tax=Thraustotheca clavata TaxID=74557 RepID=A0A1V9YVB8_9STRA|nr:ankyrin repeat protein [Thraustotheca clavata]
MMQTKAEVGPHEALLLEEGHAPLVVAEKKRKRNVQHVATHEDKLRVMKWMVAEEQKVQDELDVKRSSSETVKIKPEKLCLATRAIAEFPELFCAVSSQANYMKATRWWKESKIYIQTTEDMPSSKKARAGRGRRALPWTVWLYEELKRALDSHPDTSTVWGNRDLLSMAKALVEASTHPIYNKDYIIPERSSRIVDNLNLRWIQSFKDKFNIKNTIKRELSQTAELSLCQWIAVSTAANKGQPIAKKDILDQASHLFLQEYDTLPAKLESTWYKSFCLRHPELNLIVEPTTPINQVSSMVPVMPASLPLISPNTSTMFEAIVEGQFKIVKGLLQQGLSPESSDDMGCTALLVATKAGQFNVVKFLLEFGARTEATDENGRTALVLATLLGQFHIVKSLLEHQANVEATDESSRTSLAIACERGDLKLVKLLLRMGANIEARDEDDNTPLMIAVKHNHMEVVVFLLKKGANVRVQDVDGSTLLEIAKHSRELSQLFLEKIATDAIC